jgi:hypothetical protein
MPSDRGHEECPGLARFILHRESSTHQSSCRGDTVCPSRVLPSDFVRKFEKVSTHLGHLDLEADEVHDRYRHLVRIIQEWGQNGEEQKVCPPPQTHRTLANRDKWSHKVSRYSLKRIFSHHSSMYVPVQSSYRYHRTPIHPNTPISLPWGGRPTKWFELSTHARWVHHFIVHCSADHLL